MKKTITLSIVSIATLGLMSFGVLSSGGKTNKTGGHGETGCGTATGCHVGLQNANTTVSVTSSGTLLSAGYVAGTTYTISITTAKTGQTLFGFDFQALNSANASVGTLTAGTGSKTSGTPLINVVHDGTGGVGTNTFTYTFTWLAPATTTGAITFWYSGLAADGDGGTGGDFWNNGSVVISPAVGLAEHTIVNSNLSVFPNPVNETAIISYELVANSTVSATLINVTGQTIATFFDKEEQIAGKQSRKLVLNPSIAKGIYFVAVNVNGKNSYKKIIVD